MKDVRLPVLVADDYLTTRGCTHIYTDLTLNNVINVHYTVVVVKQKNFHTYYCYILNHTVNKNK